MRNVLFMLLAVLATACHAPLPQAYNGCKGSLITITESEEGNRVLVKDLPFNQSATLDIHYDRYVTLLAVGVSDKDGHGLGSATWATEIYSSNGPTGPSEPPVWQITSLYSSDPNGGCER